MAIDRLWQSGFETGSELEVPHLVGVPTVNAAQSFTGTYSFLVHAEDTEYGRIFIPNTKQVRLGMMIYFDSGGYGSLANGNFLSLKSSGTTIVAVGFQALAEKASHDFNLYANAGWQGATVSHPLAVSTWKRITVDLKIDAVAGWVKVWIDNTLEYNYSGNTGNVDLNEFVLLSDVQASAGHNLWRADDVYIDDTTGEGSPAASPPALRFYWLSPDGVGNYSQWTPSAGNNWQCVDEIPPSEADYVDIAAVDQLDSYTMTTVAAGAGEKFDALIPIAFVRREEATEEIALGTRYSGTDLVGSDQVPKVTTDFLWERQTTKPGGGAWDQASIDAVEALIKSRGSY